MSAHHSSADAASAAASVRTARPGGSHISHSGSAAAHAKMNVLSGTVMDMASSGAGTLTIASVA